MKPFILSMAGVLLAATLPIVAHHSVAAEFDSNKPVTIKGSVTKLEWMNPHAWLYVDAKNEQGQVEKWQFEFGAPNELVRRGWRRTDLKEGQEVTVQGIMARKGGNTASARSILLPDGKRVFNGQAQAGE
jgi:DNA/RNA endonuclease YhcR with UshA esterase domain